MSTLCERLPNLGGSTTLVVPWQPHEVLGALFWCLLSLVLISLVVMSAKKKFGLKTKISGTKRMKKVRSISMSVDLECSGRVTRSRSAAFQNRGADYERYRTISATECVENYLLNEEVNDLKVSMGKLLSKIKEDCFPFAKLPADCKLKVFSFLNPRERGVAAQVCTEWNSLMKSSSLWNVIDLTQFSLCTVQSKRHKCSELCYSNYRVRLKKFFSYMSQVKPVIRNLRFAYDIGDYQDGWLDILKTFIKAARCQELEFAHLNWKETPIKPFWSESHHTWSTNDYNELMHRHRHRQRLFISFFDLFTASAPNVSRLILPFDWSSRSLSALSRLKRLEMLVLEKYFVFQKMEQSSLDQLFKFIPRLKRLILEVWTPSGSGLQLFSIKSDTLEYLDISQCRGFYVSEFNLPKLKVLKVSRHPWNGPLVAADTLNIPCFYQVLVEGAPNLQQINEHNLASDWKDDTYQDLETVLKSVCSCRLHKSGWAM